VTRRQPLPFLPAAAILLLVLSAPGLGSADGEAGGRAALGRPDGPLSPAALRAATARLMEFGPRPVGAAGHDDAASYVGGRFLLGGLKPILTDTFPCPAPSGRPPNGGPPSGDAVCGSVVALAHALPLADAWSLMKGEAEAFTFAHPPRPDLEAALAQAAEDEGVSRLTPFDVFKRPSPLFPRAVVRCLLRRLVRREAGDDAEVPTSRAAVAADMLRRLARAHEAVLVVAPLDMRPAPGAGDHGADESASLVVLCGLAEHVVCASPRPRTRTLVCAALDGHWRGAAGARSLAAMLGPADDRVSRGGAQMPRAGADADNRAAGAETRRAAIGEPSEDVQLAGLLGPSEAAARAEALAETLEARPEDADVVAEAEDVLVRLLRLEPYRVRLVVCLDLSSDGRALAVHLASAGGEEGAAHRGWLAAAVRRAEERSRTPFSGGTAGAGDTASAGEAAAGHAQTALAARGRPVLLLQTAGAPRDRWFTAGDTVQRMDAAALSVQARAVAALVEEILAAETLSAGDNF